MSLHTHRLDALEQQTLVDGEQWALLTEALGESTLLHCADECLNEVIETWLAPGVKPLTWSDAQYMSAAHRSAGVSGTMAFHRLQQIFLSMEKPENSEHKVVSLNLLNKTVLLVQQWLLRQS